MKNQVTPAGIEPATFRFVAQHLNHCATVRTTNICLENMRTIFMYNLKGRGGRAKPVVRFSDPFHSDE